MTEPRHELTPEQHARKAVWHLMEEERQPRSEGRSSYALTAIAHLLLADWKERHLDEEEPDAPRQVPS